MTYKKYAFEVFSVKKLPHQNILKSKQHFLASARYKNICGDQIDVFATFCTKLEF